MENFTISYLLPLAYILIIAGLALSLFFAIKRMGVNIRRTIRTLIGLGGLLLIIFIGYSITTGSNNYFDSFGVNSNQERWIETALFLTYVAGFIAILSIVVIEIKSVLKK